MDGLEGREGGAGLVLIVFAEAGVVCAEPLGAGSPPGRKRNVGDVRSAPRHGDTQSAACLSTATTAVGIKFWH